VDLRDFFSKTTTFFYYQVVPVIQVMAHKQFRQANSFWTSAYVGDTNILTSSFRDGKLCPAWTIFSPAWREILGLPCNVFIPSVDPKIFTPYFSKIVFCHRPTLLLLGGN
jgi:hypothetical protein